MKKIKFINIIISVILLVFVTNCADILNKENINSLGHIGLEPLAVKDVTFFSESLQRDMHINIVLPREYDKSNISYPTLYLCHGFTSNYHEFVHVGVPEYLNRFDMIVVMVDVGNSSYVNWAESEDGQPLNFADHVCVDVINYVDKNYRTIAERKGRAINGISMGANGAITMGLSHPNLFCSIAGHSGGYSFDQQRVELKKSEEEKSAEDEMRAEWFKKMVKDTTMYYRDINIEGFSTMKDRTPKGKMFTSEEQIDAVDPFKLVIETPLEELPHIYIDCGVNDFLYEPTKKFMNFLTDNKIPFVFGQGIGTHEEDYWGQQVSISMAVQYGIMLRNIWGKEFEVYNPYTFME
ncbi:MAG: alpha/beta hydrolase-fold protein [Candidatus Neomarinimicrobiota bacterium]